MTSQRAGAQVPTVRRDSTVDSTAAARRDSAATAEAERVRLARERALLDTIKVALAQSEVPRPMAIGEPYAWDRSRLAASGALTLGELIDRIPGVTTFRAGWISAPEMAALAGRFDRVRIFLDGVEVDPLSSRLKGQHDLALIDLWQIEDATVEVAADEVRIHLRNWRVRNTTPVTRIDINTGDLQTNLYRGFYGRRFPGGQVLQLAGNHYSTLDRRSAEGGDQTTLWGRVGVARGSWTFDATMLRSGRKFTERELDNAPADTAVDMDGLSTIAIGRAAWGNPESGPWMQALASAQSFSIRHPSTTVIDSIEGSDGGGPDGSSEKPDTILVSNDTTNSRPQFVLTGGLSRGQIRLSAAGRVRRWHGETIVSPALRVGYVSGGMTWSLLGERSPLDSVQRIEVGASLNLAGRSMLTVLAGQYSPIAGKVGPTTRAIRTELGLRMGRLWVSGGSIFRDTTVLPAAVAFDTAYRTGIQARSRGFLATARGKFYRDVGLDVTAVRYSNAGIYRPQYETRSRLYLDSDMRGKYPSGNLNILLAVTHEYRTKTLFPTEDGLRESSQYRTWSAELEIRLLTATIMFQYRNFLNAQYQQVPGFTLPGITSFYGVRWTFAN